MRARRGAGERICSVSSGPQAVLLLDLRKCARPHRVLGHGCSAAKVGHGASRRAGVPVTEVKEEAAQRPEDME